MSKREILWYLRNTLAVVALILACILITLSIQEKLLNDRFKNIKSITIEKPIPTPKMINKP